MTTTHSSSQRLSTQLNTAQHQQHTACQPTCPTGLVTTAHRTRLDPVCARDSFGASPCFRGRAGIWRGSPCCLPRAVFTCIHICISHMYIYMYTHMYITHQRHPRHAYESPSRVPRRSCALSSAALLFQHAGVCIGLGEPGVCGGCRPAGFVHVPRARSLFSKH